MLNWKPSIANFYSEIYLKIIELSNWRSYYNLIAHLIVS